VHFDSVLAIGLSDLDLADLGLKPSEIGITDDDVEALVAERMAARTDKDFAKSDELRDRLAAVGVTVEDHPSGESTWRWSR